MESRDTHRQNRNVAQNMAEKQLKYKEFMCKDTTNVEYEMYDCTSNNWHHRKRNKRYKEKSGSHTRKTLNRFTTKDKLD